jgi:hypothetical protein
MTMPTRDDGKLDQIEFQKGLAAALARFGGEFGMGTTVGELLTFAVIATQPNITLDELVAKTGLGRRRAAGYIRSLSEPQQRWHRRRGLIRPMARDGGCGYTVTLKGGLVARALFLMMVMELRPDPGPE